MILQKMQAAEDMAIMCASVRFNMNGVGYWVRMGSYNKLKSSVCGVGENKTLPGGGVERVCSEAMWYHIYQIRVGTPRSGTS